jgi:hypothetical protein
MHEGEDSYYNTDLSFAALVDGLSCSTPPLIAIAPGTRNVGTIPRGTVTLTNFGRDVLRGRRDRVATCGVDRWLGGVHLLPNADVWRWDDEHGRITRS